MKLTIDKATFAEWYCDSPHACQETCKDILMEGTRFDLETVWGELSHLPLEFILSHRGLELKRDAIELTNQQLREIPFKDVDWVYP